MKNLYLISKNRFLSITLLTLLTMLLIGAGQLTDKTLNKNQNISESKLKISEIANILKKDIPQNKSNEWNMQLYKNPKLFLKINTANFSSVK